MKNFGIPILICFCVVIFSSCKIGGALRDFHSVSRNIDDVSSKLKPIDSLVMDATSGLLTELSNSNSQEKMDSITARLNRSLNAYLTKTFQDLDLGSMGHKLTQGAIDPLLSDETEVRMKQLISSLSAQMSHDIAKSITELTSPANKAKLNSLLTSFFSEANSKMLSSFINRSLRDIDFDTLGSRMADQMIAKNLKPQVDSVIRTAVKAVFDEIRHNDNAKGIFGDFKNVLFLGLGLIGAIMGLLFWWNRRKSMKLNRMLVEAIQDLDDRSGKDVKMEVAKKARSEGLLTDLHKVFDQAQLFKKKET
ncbi:MAG: hypothetical protein IPP15_09090 [Saprospiraceae bacterium]|uniref:Uncharacterized protein n=1 Tax=Candidatus Opimibacter skivensis TaxID=2982028 RepID=A0A9D7SUZ0_9BACT|nr:hypothetical protein [Candidatus Opimibacter skivensis]